MTYSIVARDAETGDFGVGVQSHYFSVGLAVPWAQPGVGAVATQSVVERAYGPKGLSLLSEGMSAPEALERLVAADPGSPLRQVAIVDAEGRCAAHTGGVCVPARGSHQGPGYSVQGNMLRSDDVWHAMGPAFESASGTLAERLLAALNAAEAAGGDVRGQQSAAILVVSGEPPENPWEGRLLDLHVEHSPRPLQELERMMRIHEAHRCFDRAQARFGELRFGEAIELIDRARSLHADDSEFAFWTGIALGNAGREDEARKWLGEAFEASPVWRELARRLVGQGLFAAAHLLE